MSKIDAYKKLLSTFNELGVFVKGDYKVDIRGELSSRILWMELSEKFGIEITDNHSPQGDYCRLSGHQFIGLYGEKHNRTISWPDDGRQPNNEWLYEISFPTGAYIFDREYPQVTFQAFFNELKTYSPAYIDSANHNLYFTHENAKAIHDNFVAIFNKHKALVDEELKLRRIEELKKELTKLQVQS